MLRAPDWIQKVVAGRFMRSTSSGKEASRLDVALFDDSITDWPWDTLDTTHSLFSFGTGDESFSLHMRSL